MFKNWALCLLISVSCMIFAIEGAYFELQTHGQYDPFVFELTDATKIEQARKILDGSETSTIHVMGRIKKTPKPYNPRYSFHIDPDTINFFDHAIEVCDANTAYVEENLDEVCGAFLPGCYWCPWTSKLVREIK